MNKQEWISNYFIQRGWRQPKGVHWEMAEEAYYKNLHGELRPCPFCGESPNLKVEHLDERYGYADQAFACEKRFTALLFCYTLCNAEHHAPTQQAL